MRSLAFVSDLSLQLSGGGAYVVNWHAFRQMERCFSAVYCGPIKPRVPVIENYDSKVRRRLLHRRGRFAYFSPSTLSSNAARVTRALPANADAILFRSAARWARCRPTVPYFVYMDAVFHTFFYNTFSPEDFDPADLERIWREEAAFLEGAAGVFFESTWGMERAREAYRLRGGHYHAPGRGGAIDPPGQDLWSGRHNLLTMAMNFRQKGGDIVLAAFRLLKPRFPSLTWHIIGGPPEGDWQSLGGIVYEGVLRPDHGAERARLQALLADAFLLIHPTREDMSPLVITEAAYFGCPAVSVNLFANPELLVHGRTGVLLDPPVTPEALAAGIAELIQDTGRYLEMRREARARAVANHSWDRVGSFMCERIRASLTP